MLERGKFDPSLPLRDGTKLAFRKIYLLDAEFDTLDAAPAELRDSKRYRDCGDFSIAGMAAAIEADLGRGRARHRGAQPRQRQRGQKAAARDLAARLPVGGVGVGVLDDLDGAAPGAGDAHRRRVRPLTYMASERVIPGYGGGMSSAKAALESDTRVLAYEAGRAWGVRVNTISAGAYASRAASAIGIIDTMIDYTSRNSPLTTPITADEVGATAAFLCSPLASGITGTTVYVDKGYQAMGMAVDRERRRQVKRLPRLSWIAGPSLRSRPSPTRSRARTVRRASSQARSRPPRAKRSKPRSPPTMRASSPRRSVSTSARWRSMRIPNTAYNLADVERRANQLENAIRDYQKYLELAPKAADRGAVAALIDQLQRTPGLFTITSTEPHGRVYIDGKFVGVAPTRASALAGPHEIDVITPISFGHDVCPMYPGGTRNCEVRVKPRVDGNVIISGPAWMGGLEWTLDGVQLALKGRRQVPPGNYALYVMRKEQQCAPVYMLVQDKPLVYFYVNGTQPDESAGAPCTKLSPLQIFVKFDDAP